MDSCTSSSTVISLRKTRPRLARTAGEACLGRAFFDLLNREGEGSFFSLPIYMPPGTTLKEPLFNRNFGMLVLGCIEAD